MTKYPRGSEWRKWDLHIHTPGTAKNDHYPSDDNWEEFLVKLEENEDIAVLGITDYFSIDNYLKAKRFQAEGRLQGKYLIPNIELRIIPVTSSETPINLHVLFDPDLSIECIEREFINNLRFEYNDRTYAANRRDLIHLGRDYKNNDSLEEDAAFREGISQFSVAYGDVKHILNRACLNGHYLVGVSNKRNDGNSGIQESAMRATRQEIYRMSHFIFSGNPNDIRYFLGKGVDSPEIVIANYGSLKPCITCSDAHELKNVNVFSENRITWIKADPTFSGLKQIVFEPEERIRIQEDRPEFKPMYNLIDKISLNENDFWRQEIPINENLSVIIGGRSTGKSTLLEGIARKVNGNQIVDVGEDNNNSRDAFFEKHLDGISVSWKDNSPDSERNVDYFPQNYMYEIARDTKKVDRLIHKIITETESNKTVLNKLDGDTTNITGIIRKKCAELFALHKKLIDYNERIRTEGNVSGIEQTIKMIQEKANSLKNNSGITVEELKAFEANDEQLSRDNAAKTDLTNDINKIEYLKQISPLDSSLKYEFNNLSSVQRLLLIKNYEDFADATQKGWIRILDNMLVAIRNNLSSCEKSISEINNDPVYIKVKEYIAANKQYSTYQEQLSLENTKLKNAKSLNEMRNTVQKQIDTLKDELVSNHCALKKMVYQTAQAIQINAEGLSVKAKPILKTDELRNYLQPKLIKRSDNQKNLIVELSDNYAEDTENKIKLLINGLLDETIQCTSGNFNYNVLQDFLAENWYTISFDLLYQEDVFAFMSPGKQAFVILKLLLEFSSRKCPILIDQPEDSLDNRAIYSELVSYLKTKKKERQIILVSHNPNVVVGSDAEQVIVANQNGIKNQNRDSFKFQYVSGSLENSSQKNAEELCILLSQGIREHVCDILEGGKEAFNRREKKYGFRD